MAAKSRRVLRDDFTQMLVGSRWISFYVMSLLVGMQWILGLLYQFFPESPWIAYGRWVFPLLFGYCTAVWLKAGARALRGRSALGDGCFSASKRNLWCASLAYVALYIPLLALQPTDPRRLPVWGLISAGGMLLVPFVLLGKQSASVALRSVREGLQRRPQLVISVLLLTGLVSVGWSRLLVSSYDFAMELVTQALYDQSGGWRTEVLRWPLTSIVANFCYLILTALGWMLPGPPALWIYWRSTKQGA